MDVFLQQLFNGLFLGAIYALIALGYTMVYGILRFINFAHGEIYMVGAFVAYFAATALLPVFGAGWPAFLLLLLMAMVVCALLGVGVRLGPSTMHVTSLHRSNLWMPG